MNRGEYFTDRNKPTFEKKKYFTYSDLEELQSYSGFEIINKLMELKDLKAIVNNTRIKEDWVVLILEIIDKIIEESSPSFLIRSLLQNPSFSTILHSHLGNLYHIDTWKFIKLSLISVKAFKYLWAEEEYDAARVLSIANIKNIIKTNEVYLSVSEFQKELVDLRFKIDSCLNLMEVPEILSAIYPFRHSSVDPTSEELFNYPIVTWSPHIEKGSYSNWEKYLNNMFYLMREVEIRLIFTCLS